MDIAQWRQDLDAFTAATRQMLDSIHDELSNGLASGQAQINVVTDSQRPNQSPELPPSLPSKDEHAHTTEHSLTSDDVADAGDQLIAKLKEQLAQQLNR